MTKVKAKSLEYSLIIPALEEATLIANTLHSVKKYLTDHGILNKTEVIVVTADSNDNTAEIVRSNAKLFPNFQFIEPGARVGKGRDVREGILRAKGKFVLFTDADLATPVTHILPAYTVLEKGADVVIGERNLYVIHTGIRKIISLTANTLTRLLVAPAIADTQCGFKGFRHDVAVDIFEKLSVMGWAFDMEVIAIATQNDLKIQTLQIKDWTENKPAESQLAGENSIRAAVKTLLEALTIGKNRFFKNYKFKSLTREIPTNE